jgi:alpha-beta hydrolase superfamily lysophospholipase
VIDRPIHASAVRRLKAAGCVPILAAFALATAAPAAIDGRPVTFSAPDGTPLAGVLYETPNRSGPGIVLVHMLGRSKDDWLWIADRLHEAGATVLALDLRGHGNSGGSGVMLEPMVTDVSAAVEWLAHRPGVRSGVAIVGASLGANLAALAAAETAAVRAVALISPSLDYRGLRIDASAMKRLGNRPVWLGASTEDPYAFRTVKDLTASGSGREQSLSAARAHGTTLLSADPDFARSLMDWLRRTLAF